jgi:hypothetical protein
MKFETIHVTLVMELFFFSFIIFYHEQNFIHILMVYKGELWSCCSIKYSTLLPTRKKFPFLSYFSLHLSVWTWGLFFHFHFCCKSTHLLLHAYTHTLTRKRKFCSFYEWKFIFDVYQTQEQFVECTSDGWWLKEKGNFENNFSSLFLNWTFTALTFLPSHSFITLHFAIVVLKNVCSKCLCFLLMAKNMSIVWHS